VFSPHHFAARTYFVLWNRQLSSWRLHSGFSPAFVPFSVHNPIRLPKEALRVPTGEIIFHRLSADVLTSSIMTMYRQPSTLTAVLFVQTTRISGICTFPTMFILIRSCALNEPENTAQGMCEIKSNFITYDSWCKCFYIWN
jgi:hypothetical protein